MFCITSRICEGWSEIVNYSYNYGDGGGRGSKSIRDELRGTPTMGHCPKTLRGKAMRYAVIASKHALTWDEARSIADKLRLTDGKRNPTIDERRLIKRDVRRALESKKPQPAPATINFSLSPATVHRAPRSGMR